MMTTKPRATATPSTALALWWAIPQPVRTELRARCPLDSTTVRGDCLIVAVGSGTPLRWLCVESLPDGLLRVRLWEVGPKLKELGHATVPADGLIATLQVFAREFALSE